MDANRNQRKTAALYAGYIAATLAVGGISAVLSRSGMENFSLLRKPPFAPPNWVFPAAWTVLYLLMAISAAMIAKDGSQRARSALFLYWAQLFVNFWWSIFFFAWELRLTAFFWLLLLLALTVGMIVRFDKIRPVSGRLNLPYLLWLVFAGILNLSVYMLNR